MSIIFYCFAIKSYSQCSTVFFPVNINGNIVSFSYTGSVSAFPSSYTGECGIQTPINSQWYGDTSATITTGIYTFSLPVTSVSFVVTAAGGTYFPQEKFVWETNSSLTEVSGTNVCRGSFSGNTYIASDGDDIGGVFTVTAADGFTTVTLTHTQYPLNWGALIALCVGSIEPLPLKLASFAATKQYTNTCVSWSTAFEQNNAYFDVEASSDGILFSNIGTIQAIGNSNSEHNYKFIHSDPGKGTHYYRLKMVEKSGKSTYSPTRVINFSEKNNLLAFPNPVKDRLSISGVKVGTQLCLLDPDGKILLIKRVKTPTETMDLQSFSNGIYFVRSTIDGEASAVIKLIKMY